MDVLKKIMRNKAFIICSGVIVLYALVGFFLAPWLTRHYVPKIIQKQINKQALIGKVRINPFLFMVEANDFRLEEENGQPIADFKRLLVDFELKSLFKWAWTFRQVRLEAPRVNGVIAKDGTLNLASLAPPTQAASEPAAKNQTPPRLVIEDLAIEKGQIDVTDLRQSEPATVSLTPLALHVNNLSTLHGHKGPHSITAALGDGGSLRWKGEISLHPFESSGNVAIENIQTATAWKFFRDTVAIRKPAGKASISTDYRVSLIDAHPQATLDKLAVVINGLSLSIDGADRPFFEMSNARLTGGRLDLEGRQVDIEKIAVAGGQARITVDQSGILNLDRIVRKTQKPVPDPPADKTAGSSKPWTLSLNRFDLSGLAAGYHDYSRSPGLDAKINEIKMSLKARVETGMQPQAAINATKLDLLDVEATRGNRSEPVVQIGHIGIEHCAYDLQANDLRMETLAIEDGALDLKRLPDGDLNLAQMFASPQKGEMASEKTDMSAKAPPFHFLARTAAVSKFRTKFSDLTANQNSPILTLEDMAAVLTNVDGKSPMSFEASVKVREGGRIKAEGTLTPTGPTVESHIEVTELGLTAFQSYVNQAAAVVIQSGTLSTRGKLRHGVRTAQAQTIYQGGFNLANLRVTEKGASEPLVGWESVQTDRLTIQLEPNRLDIGDLKVRELIGKFIIEKDHSTNISNLIKSKPTEKSAASASPKTSPAAGKVAFPYRIARIRFSEGEVEFADQSLFTPFGTRIQQLNGVVTGVSSADHSRARVKLDGSVDRYGTANIEGAFDASDPKTFTNIGIVFRNVEMSRLTPYSGTFAGRKIDSGKLSLDLKYEIDNHQLKGDNQFIVERLTLGEKVQSQKAVTLPLDLAVALLEDANGVINLGLPVSGSLDSPEFSYGVLIWKALVNLLTKIVTSPFRALASLLPGGEEEAFNVVAFADGRADLPPPEKEKLAKLAEILQKRPQLRLIVQGRYHPETDRTELKSVRVHRVLAARIGQGPGITEHDTPVDFNNPETGHAIESMFSERFGADTLAALKADHAATLDKAKQESAAAKPDGDGATAIEEAPERFTKDLFKRLVAAEPVDESSLVKLADARAQGILTELTDAGQLSSDRISVTSSAPIDDGKAMASALLSLEAGKS